MRLLLLTLFSAAYSTLFSQGIIVKGKVMDSTTGLPIPGVNIYNEKKTSGTASDFNGEYQIKAKLRDTLIFSAVGYTITKKKIEGPRLTVALKENAVQLDEIQVRASANINDIDLREAVGAIATVAMNKVQDRPSINIIESLQGQVAGVSIKSDGELGKPLKIRVRGTSTLSLKTKSRGKDDKQALDNRANQPLFVMDGQVITAEAFATLNVHDIQEIKVLKDAAANALYGIKAANGVIEITSKRGIDGKTQYSFSFQKGLTLKGKPSVKMMDTAEKLEFERLAKNRNTPGYYLSETYYRAFYPDSPDLEQRIAEGKRKLDSLRQINTDWFRELARISTYQSYNLSVRGGNKKNRFYLSGNFTEQGGKFDGNNIHRFTGRLNYEYNFSKNVHMMFLSGFGVSENNTPNSSSYSPSQLIYELNPYERPRGGGELVSYPNRTFTDLVNQYSKNTKGNRFNFSSNLFAKLSKHLHLSSILGMDYLYQGTLAIVPRTAFSEVSRGIPERERGKVSKTKTYNVNVSTNTRINFEKTYGRHQVSASANTDYFRSHSDFIGISGYGLPSKLNSGAGINNDITGTRKSRTQSRKNTEAQLGFGFSGWYKWNDKMELYGSYKKDGSSLLPSDKRWNTFWATGLGYTLINKTLPKDNKWISYAKIRATYGVTASLAGITASLAVPTFTYGEKGYLGIREFYLKSLFNSQLRPEQNTSINLGMDLGIAHRVNVSIEAYGRRTDDMLLTVPIAPSNGFYEQLKNVGVMDNRGIELSVNATLWATDAFTWSTSANLSYNDNKVIDLYEGTELNLSNNPYPDYREGEPADLIYGLVNLGIHPVDGTPRYQRADGSEFHGNLGKPDPEDFKVLGHSTPPCSGGWYHSLRYQNWRLSFDLYYSFGGKATYSNQSVVFNSTDANKNAVRGQLHNTWFEPGDEGKLYASLQLGSGEIYTNRGYATNRSVGKTDFIRLNNAMISYQFDHEAFGKLGKYMSSFRVYAQVKNIITWSNFKGGDPESANLVGSAQPVITTGTQLSF